MMHPQLAFVDAPYAAIAPLGVVILPVRIHASSIHSLIVKSPLTQATSIINGYLYVWNKPGLKKIVVTGILQDVFDLTTIPKCDDEGNIISESCYNILEDDFNIELSLQPALYKMCVNLLQYPLQIVKDITNDKTAQN